MVLAPLGIERLDLKQLDTDKPIVGAVRPAGQAVTLGSFPGQRGTPGRGANSTGCNR